MALNEAQSVLANSSYKLGNLELSSLCVETF